MWDYHRVNEVTQKDAYHLEVTSDCLYCLNGAKYMSSLDVSFDSHLENLNEVL